ncbi:MAG: divalent-cation tolerance protein CutA [Desulfurococcales archaeon]|nr:divalent-cation tolerance protein CutA [Desulfurococcales archaeon]
MGYGYAVVLVTTPAGQGGEIARSIVERRLAACVNVVSGVKSLYLWKGALESDGEDLLIIKTRIDKLEKLIDEVKEMHPYEVPEIIALPIIAGNNDYLKWIDEEVR